MSNSLLSLPLTEFAKRVNFWRRYEQTYNLEPLISRHGVIFSPKYDVHTKFEFNSLTVNVETED